MRITLILISILLTSCHIALCTWSWGYEQLTVEPAREKIIGYYELNESSQEYLADEGFRKENYKLELLDNGLFKFVNGPDIILDEKRESNKKLINKEGKWWVSCADSYDCMIELEGVCVVPLTEKDGRLAILITIGDGDECNGIVYEKVE